MDYFVTVDDASTRTCPLQDRSCRGDKCMGWAWMDDAWERVWQYVPRTDDKRPTAIDPPAADGRGAWRPMGEIKGEDNWGGDKFKRYWKLEFIRETGVNRRGYCGMRR